jgi:DNA-binding MarR family transcriptional regulator
MGIDRTSEEDFGMSYLQDRILDFLKSNPGKTYTEIADGVGSNPTTLYHAMDGLRRFGLVRAKYVGHKVLWEAA